MRFFVPNNKFFEFIDSLKTTDIVEFGCGDGSLLREFKQRNIHAYGIDPRYTMFDEPMPHDVTILPFEAELHQKLWDKEHNTLIVCRPCHSGFADTLAKMRKYAKEYYYVGLEKNLEKDFDSDPPLVIANVGEDGENVYKLH